MEDNASQATVEASVETKDASTDSASPKKKRKMLGLKIPLYIIVASFALMGFLTAVQSIVEGVSFTEQLATNIQSFDGTQNNAIARAFAGTDAIRNAGGIVPEDDPDEDDKNSSSSSSSSSASSDAGNASGSGSGSNGSGGSGSAGTSRQSEAATVDAPGQTTTETIETTVTEQTTPPETHTETFTTTEETPIVFEEALPAQIIYEEIPGETYTYTTTPTTTSPMTTTTTTTTTVTEGGYTIQYALAQEAVMGAGAYPYLGAVSAPVGQSVHLYTLADTGWEPYALAVGYHFLGWSLDYGAATPDFLPGATVGSGLMHPDGAAAQAGDTIYLFGVWQKV